MQALHSCVLSVYSPDAKVPQLVMISPRGVSAALVPLLLLRRAQNALGQSICTSSGNDGSQTRYVQQINPNARDHRQVKFGWKEPQARSSELPLLNF